MRKHAVVFVDVERDQSTDGRDAVQRVKEEPLVFRERHHASIMEFENLTVTISSIARISGRVSRWGELRRQGD